jgi:prolyl-tRNA editing enzyme YbaK/EbsC (Cys-tRNA(Pro) deacylase)
MEELSRGPSRVAEELLRLGVTSAVKEMPESTRTAVEAAAALGCDVAQIVKSLIFRSVVGDEALLVLVSGADRVDEPRLAEVVGEQVVKATGNFVRARTGYAIGGVPPVGHTQHVVTYLDEHLLDHGLVWAAAGSPRAVFPIKPADLLRITSAKVVAVAAAQVPAAAPQVPAAAAQVPAADAQVPAADAQVPAVN